MHGFDPFGFDEGEDPEELIWNDPDMDVLEKAIASRHIPIIYDVLNVLRKRTAPVSTQRLSVRALEAFKLPVTVFEDICSVADPEKLEDCVDYMEIGISDKDAELSLSAPLSVLAAVCGKPGHLRALLEMGFDCNGKCGVIRTSFGGVELASSMRKDRKVLHGKRRYLEPKWEIEEPSPLAAALIALAEAGRRGDMQLVEGIRACIDILTDWPGVRVSSSSSVTRALTVIEQEGGFPAECCMDTEKLTGGEPLLFRAAAHICTAGQFERLLKQGACKPGMVKGILSNMGSFDSATEDIIEKYILFEKYYPEVCREEEIRLNFLRMMLYSDRPEELSECCRRLFDNSVCLNPVFHNLSGVSAERAGKFFKSLAGCRFTLQADSVDCNSIGFSGLNPSVRTLSLIIKNAEFQADPEKLNRFAVVIISKGNVKLAKLALKKGVFSKGDTKLLLELNDRIGSPEMKPVILMGASCQGK